MYKEYNPLNVMQKFHDVFLPDEEFVTNNDTMINYNNISYLDMNDNNVMYKNDNANLVKNFPISPIKSLEISSNMLFLFRSSIFYL